MHSIGNPPEITTEESIMTDTNTTSPVPASGPSEPARSCDRDHHHRRGGFFKGLFAGALLFAVVAGGAYVGSSHAHPGAAGRHAMWHGNLDADGSAKRINAMVGWVLSDIDATADQKSKIGSIAQAALKDLLPLRDEHKAARARVAELLAAATVDRHAIEALRANEFKLAESASKRLTQAIADAAEVLEPAQRAKLAEKMKQRMDRRG